MPPTPLPSSTVTHKVVSDERYVDAADGTRLWLRTWPAASMAGGARQAPRTALVLCDGLGCDLYIWKYVIARFGGERPLVHLSWRGHGRSEVPRDLSTVRIDVLVADLAAVLDQLGVERAVLLGHSMGVQVCLEAFRAPAMRSRVRGLGLLCGSYQHPIETWHHAMFEGDDPPIANRLMRRVFDDLTRNVVDGFLRWRPLWRRLVLSELAYRQTVRGELTPELIKREDFTPYMAHLADMDMRVFAALARDFAKHSARDVLPDVDVPALVVGGGRDRFAPLWLSEQMAEQMTSAPHKELLRLVLGSHAAPIEEPRLIERALLRLLDAVDGR